jgi:hypothetical protein
MAFDAASELEDSHNYPNLRLYTITDTAADTPQIDGKSKSNYQWGVSNASSFQPVGGPAFSYFSATCYFFGRDLYKALGGAIPIGLVASDWGGQKVECSYSYTVLYSYCTIQGRMFLLARCNARHHMRWYGQRLFRCVNGQ